MKFSTAAELAQADEKHARSRLDILAGERPYPEDRLLLCRDTRVEAFSKLFEEMGALDTEALLELPGWRMTQARQVGRTASDRLMYVRLFVRSNNLPAMAAHWTYVDCLPEPSCYPALISPKGPFVISPEYVELAQLHPESVDPYEPRHDLETAVAQLVLVGSSVRAYQASRPNPEMVP